MVVKPQFHSNVKQLLGEDFSRLLQEISPFVEPRIDVYESNQNYILSIDLAGARREDFSVKRRNDSLIIAGTIHQNPAKESSRVISRERFYGSFIRELSIPRKCNADQLAAVFERGILMITIPCRNSKENNHDID